MSTTMLFKISLLVYLATSEVECQVCSAVGQLCSRSTDCCRGCCEGHVCIERNFPCSSDLGINTIGNSCDSFACPPGQFCIMTPMCPPEAPCPQLQQATCRRLSGLGYGNQYYWRNSSNCLQITSLWLLLLLFTVHFCCNAMPRSLLH